MPAKEIDGIQLLKVLREKYPKIPRIIFTYGDMKKDFNQVIQHGADYYIRKNGDPKSQFAELSHIVRRTVKARENEQKMMRLNRVYSVPARVSEAIVHVHNRMQLMQEVCRIAIQEGGYAMVWIGFEDPENHRIKGAVASGAVDDFFVNVRMSAEDLSNGQGPTVAALRKGKHILCNDIQADAPTRHWAEHAIKKGYLSATPDSQIRGGKTQGVITFYSPQRNFFTESEVRLLNGVTEDVSFALGTMELDENRRLVQEQLEQTEHG